MQHKECSSCKQTKSVADFTSAGRGKNNFKTTDTYHSHCKACNAERARKWRKVNPNYRGTGKNSKVPVEDRLTLSAIRQRIVDCKQRAKKYDQPEPTIDEDFLFDLLKHQQQMRCALTGVTMVVKKGHPLCISLDKIEADGSYSPDNVQWVTWAANRAKGDLDTSVFIDMCACVIEYQKVQRLSKGSVS